MPPSFCHYWSSSSLCCASLATITGTTSETPISTIAATYRPTWRACSTTTGSAAWVRLTSSSKFSRFPAMPTSTSIFTTPRGVWFCLPSHWFIKAAWFRNWSILWPASLLSSKRKARRSSTNPWAATRTARPTRVWKPTTSGCWAYSAFPTSTPSPVSTARLLML